MKNAKNAKKPSLWSRVKAFTAKKLAAAKAFALRVWAGAKAVTHSASPVSAAKAVAVRAKNGAVAVYRWFAACTTAEKVWFGLAAVSVLWHLGTLGLVATFWIFTHAIFSVTLAIGILITIGAATKMIRNFRAAKEGAPAEGSPAPQTVRERARAKQAEKAAVLKSLNLSELAAGA